MRCGACGRDVRSTTLALVLPLNEVKRVCDDCRRGGVTIVSRAPSTVTAEHAPLSEQERSTRSVLRSLAHHIRGLATATSRAMAGKVGDAESFSSSMTTATLVAYETCADIAEAWAARPNARGVDVDGPQTESKGENDHG